MAVLTVLSRGLCWLCLAAALLACSCDDDDLPGVLRDSGADGRVDARAQDARAPIDAAAVDAQRAEDGSAPDGDVPDGDIPDTARPDAEVPDASSLDAMLEAGPADAMVPPPIEPCTSMQTFESLTVGSRHVCAIRSDGALLCWGLDDHGQLGDGTPGGARHQATQVESAKDWTEVEAGLDYTCGVRGVGSLYCWGYDQYGRLGDGDPIGDDVASPSQVGSLHGWSGLSAGAYNACAIRDGNTYCWGHGADGRLGDGNTMDRSEPSLVSNTLAQVATAGGHSCGVLSEDSRGQCWGSNGSRAIGIGSNTPSSSSVPLDVQGSTSWDMISTGSFHTCGIDSSGALYCWGSSGTGQLGSGNRTTQNAPVRVGADTDWESVSAGSLHSCGIKVGGSLYCWGSNSQGQLGTGGTSSDVPVLVRDLSFKQVDAHGSAGTCGITTDGFIYCWGDNDDGQLGLVRADSIRPVRVCP